MWKTHRTQNFLAPRQSWYSFGGIWKPFQSSHLKNHQFHFFIKLPTKPSSYYVVVHRQPWPCAKPTELKTFMHQGFHGIHLGTFVGLSNPHISKITNFIFSQNSPPSQSSYAVVHRQPWPCAKPTELKTFVHQDFHGIHLGTFVGLSNAHISKITNFIFSHNSPPSHLAMSWCKTHRTQNFGARRLRWYSLGDICRPFQPSHLKNHEFQFFTKLPTKPSSSVVVHQSTWPCAIPTELKTFVHQDIHGTHLGHL